MVLPLPSPGRHGHHSHSLDLAWHGLEKWGRGKEKGRERGSWPRTRAGTLTIAGELPATDAPSHHHRCVAREMPGRGKREWRKGLGQPSDRELTARAHREWAKRTAGPFLPRRWLLGYWPRRTYEGKLWAVFTNGPKMKFNIVSFVNCLNLFQKQF